MTASAHPANGVSDRPSTARSLTDADGRVWPFSDIEANSAAMSENGYTAVRPYRPAVHGTRSRDGKRTRTTLDGARLYRRITCLVGERAWMAHSVRLPTHVDATGARRGGSYQRGGAAREARASGSVMNARRAFARGRRSRSRDAVRGRYMGLSRAANPNLQGPGR